jgi:spore germination protein KA
LFEDIQNSDDYYTLETSVSFRRLVRLVGAAIALVLPGLYIAIQLYHYNIVPINLLITITNTVQNSPFSPMLETLFVLILFEIIYEASLHMPKHLGSATSLVGALVLGDTAVKAGLISSPAVLVCAVSGITMYILPNLAPQISILRFFFALVGGLLGIYGIVLTGVMLMVYLAGMDSYGAPYLAPYSPLIKNDLKDGIIKTNLRNMRTRPRSIPNQKPIRQKPSS